MDLRSYQHEAIDSIEKAWANGVQRAAVVAATGLGKTIIFSDLVRRLEASGQRVLILAHREELILQTVSKLQALGCKSVGVVKAERNETWARIVVATVQTLYSEKRRRMIGGVDVVIADEMHHFASRRNRQLLTDLGCFGGHAKAAGFTATFVRSDKHKLSQDWEVIFERDVIWGIEHGYLTDVVAHSIRVSDLDLSNVKSKAGGDFADGDLGAAMHNSKAVEVAVKAWRRYADGKPTILFAPTVAVAQEFALGFLADGVPAESVFGTTESRDRQGIYSRLRGGQTKVLCSVGVLTEGFDIPAIECAILARPTKSKGLWQQMAGRALRLFPGKDQAILLDITGDVENHSIASITDLTEPRETKPDEPPERGVTLCACSESHALCCTVGETAMWCARNKRKGLCSCLCVCGENGPEEEIVLVSGDHDVEVDLFAGSSTAWLKTGAGINFIATAQRVWFIAQQPGIWEGYRVGYSGTTSSMEGGGWATDPMDMTAAMAIAQERAQAEDASIARRDSKWRKTKPSNRQLQLALGYGLLPADMATTVRKGPVSDILSIYFTSRMLDPKVGVYIAP